MTTRIDLDVVPPAVGTLHRSSAVVELGLASDEYELLRLQCPIGHVLLRANDPDELLRHMSSSACALVVLDGTMFSTTAIQRIVEVAVARDLPLVLMVHLSMQTAQQLLLCAAAGASLSVVLKGFDDLPRCVAGVLASHRPLDAVSALAHRFPGDCSAQTRLLVAEAAVLGRRKSTVVEWAAVRGESVRSVERRLAEQVLPTAKHILNRILLLHTIWRISVLNWPPKAAAAAAGAATTRDLFRPLRRAGPIQMRGALKLPSFPDACDEFFRWISSPQVRTQRSDR